MFSHSKSNLLQHLTFASIKQCTQIHAQMIITGRARRSPAISHLLRSLVDLDTCNLPHALAIFRQIPGPTTFLWNTVIRACSRLGAPQESISLYLEMSRNSVVPDNYTFQFLFKACALCFSFRAGQAIHGNHIKVFDVSNVFVVNSLIHMYSEFGWVDVAGRVFDEMGQKNVVSWTVIVGGYVKIGDMREALRVFDEMPERNVVSWTSMIAGYAQNDLAEEAVGLFKRMVVDGVRLDAVAMVSVLSACAQLGDLYLGKWVHQFVERERINITQNLGVALIDMYTKCGDVNAARQVFDRMVWKIVAAWNAMIDGYCKLGDFESALLLFDQMGKRNLITFNSMITGYIQSSSFMEALLLFAKLQASDLKPDEFTMVGLLTARANLGVLDQGKCLHTLIEESSIESDVFLGTCHGPNSENGFTEFPIAESGANSLRSALLSDPNTRMPDFNPGILQGGFSV